MANSFITEITPTGFAGRFEHNGATGNWNANGQKILNNISGDMPGYGSFEANRYDGQNWNYNPHFTDPTKAADLIDNMTAIVAGVQQDLNGVD